MGQMISLVKSCLCKNKLPAFTVKSEPEEIEKIPHEALHHEVELPLLLRQLRFAANKSKFWRDWFSRAKILPEDIRSMDAYQELPLSDKQDLLADQKAAPPFGTILAVKKKQLARIHRTSGSTDTPLLVLLTKKDIKNTVIAGGRAFKCAGVTPEDVVIHCLNYSMWSGGVTDHQCLEKAGAAVIPFGVGNSRYLIETIKRIRPTAISCTPSYLARLEELLRDDFNEKPDSLGLKKALLGGEGGLQDPVYRASIENKWGLEAVDANYGLSDVLSIIGAECHARRGLHFHGQGIVMPELIDSQSNPIPIKAGAEGELVLTCLLREGQPIFRYRTHDALRIIDTETCQCGRSGFLFMVVGRTDDMIDVKGINFFPNALQGTLRRFSDVLSGEYRVVVPPAPFRALGLRVELSGIGGAPEGLRDRIVSVIRSEHSVLVELEFLPRGALEKSENKTSRLIRL